MDQCWFRVIKDNRLQKDCLVALPEGSAWLERACELACSQLDIPQPQLLIKHHADMARFRLTRLLPDNFIEPVRFDRLEISLFSQKPDNAPRY